MDARRVKGKARRLVDLDDAIYGVHAVNEALVAGEPLLHIHIGEERRRDRALGPLTTQAQAAGIPIRYEDRTFFNQFPYKAHQSVLAVGKPFVYADLNDIVRRATPHRLLAVALDHMTDPHNVGAIIRTVECVGANGVIIPDRRAAGINATVRKAAAGATAHLPIAQVTNLATALRELKAQDIWVIGADAGAGSVAYTEIDYNKSVVVVIGAEGAGLSELIRRQCDEIAAIPLAGRISSLNASVAAGVMLYEIRRQRMVS